MIAVILAGGLGSRLKEKTKQKPKGFLEVDGISLIERNITNLLEVGIKKIYIGTGYLSEVYEEFAKDKSYIRCIKSQKYKTTSSMYTLYNMKDEVDRDFLLLESDLLYEIDALKSLIDDNKKDIILSSGATNSGDEVYIDADKSLNLRAMSKNKQDLSFVYSELVGISKISLLRYKMMCKAYESERNKKIDYEYIMTQTARKKPFFVKKIENLIWCEIDDDTHLKRAYKEILPSLKEKINLRKWNNIKENISFSKQKQVAIGVGKIYFVSVGQNIGVESYGKNNLFLRPVLVYKILSNNYFLGIPLTSGAREGSYYYHFSYKKDKISSAMFNQIKVFDTKRIAYYSGKIKYKNLTELKNKFLKFVNFTP